METNNPIIRDNPLLETKTLTFSEPVPFEVKIRAPSSGVMVDMFDDLFILLAEYKGGSVITMGPAIMRLLERSASVTHEGTVLPISDLPIQVLPDVAEAFLDLGFLDALKLRLPSLLSRVEALFPQEKKPDGNPNEKNKSS